MLSMEAQSQIFKMHGATCVKMNAKGQLKIVFLIMKARFINLWRLPKKSLI